MSIFGIIILSLLIAFMFAGAFLLACYLCGVCDYNVWPLVVSAVIVVVLTVAFVFMGIGIDTEGERVYVAQYEAQKATIEESLKSDVLTGLERIELVKVATELNGEMARRKANFGRWDHVYYDNSIYDGVTPIDLSGQ